MLLSDKEIAVINHIHSTGSEYTQSVSHVRKAPAPTFLIDGPSGAGKTTLSNVIETKWNSAVKLQVIHMDDIYPGWDGLAEASAVVLRMLTERSDGEDTHWQRYDWHKKELAEWHSVDAGEPLLIEGCGSMPLGAERYSQARIWCDASVEVRKTRALSRGDEDFESHWNQWEELYSEFVLVNAPERIATIKLL